MTISSQTALDLFHSGYNCAQSVLLAFGDMYGYDRKILEALSQGFGGGMGRMQRTCGAVTGAFMAIGLFADMKIQDDSERQERTRELIRDFHSRFLSEHRYSECIELIGYDVNTPEGQEKFSQPERKERICDPCVASAVNILNELFDRETV